MDKSITVSTTISAPIEKVWQYWNDPAHITKWCNASDDWGVPYADADVRVGGKFKTTMAAKDKSASFDFVGTYTNVVPNELIEYEMPDGRKVKITFTKAAEGITVTETFDMEHENSEEIQRNGWQSILNNFKKHVEGN